MASRAKSALGGSHKKSHSKKGGHVHRMTIERSHGNKHYIVKHQSPDDMGAPGGGDDMAHVVGSPDEMSAHLDQHMPLEQPAAAAAPAPGPGQAPPSAGGAMQGM